jgi:hypothetical protein
LLPCSANARAGRTAGAGGQLEPDKVHIKCKGDTESRTIFARLPVVAVPLAVLAASMLGVSAAGAPTIARAEVHVEGTASAVHVTTDRDAIPDVLSAFETPFNLRYRTAVALNGNVSSEYSGSLAHVISRLLGGYDYVIAHDRGTIELAVWGRRGEASAGPKASP